MKRFCAVLLVTTALYTAAAVGAASPILVTAAARSIRPGELVVLTIVPGAAGESVGVHVFNRAIPVFKTAPAKWQALVGIDLTTTPGTYNVTITAGTGDHSARTTYPLVRPRPNVPDPYADGGRCLREPTARGVGAD